MKTRLTAWALALSLGAVCAAGGPAAAEQPQTQPASHSRGLVTVSGPVVRLGDLFSNPGPEAEAMVDQAPTPGGEKTYDVYQLAAIARAHGLLWQAQSWSEKVVIKRPGQVIDAEAIKNAVRTALEGEGLEGKWELAFSRGLASLHVAAGRPALPRVVSLQWQQRSGYFSAVVTAARPGTDEPQLTVSGRAYRLIEVPTLNRRIKTGDIIGPEDIKWLNLRAGRVNRNVITDAEQLIGMTPQRFVAAGRPVRAGDVRKPRMVKKNGIVTMVVTTPNMVLTSKGRALDHGSHGDTIRIQNLKSKTVVEAEITGPNAVRIVTATSLPSVNTARR